jgi:hypothetical protein
MNQGTKLVLLMKKNRSKKSRASVPLKPDYNKPIYTNACCQKSGGIIGRLC